MSAIKKWKQSCGNFGKNFTNWSCVIIERVIKLFVNSVRREILKSSWPANFGSFILRKIALACKFVFSQSNWHRELELSNQLYLLVFLNMASVGRILRQTFQENTEVHWRKVKNECSLVTTNVAAILISASHATLYTTCNFKKKPNEYITSNLVLKLAEKLCFLPMAKSLVNSSEFRKQTFTFFQFVLIKKQIV